MSESSASLSARWTNRLAELQYRFFAFFLLGGIALAAASYPLVRQLGLNSDFTALLPTYKPSVQDLEKARGRVGGLNTLTVALQSKNSDALQRFARELVPRLERLDIPQVRSVDWNIAAYEDFVRAHAHLYADEEDLVTLRDALQERIDYEKLKLNPVFVDLSDEPPPDPRTVLQQLREKNEAQLEKTKRFPGGFYLHPDGDLLAIFLRTDVSGGDVASGNRIIARIDRLVAELQPKTYAPDLHVEYAGDLIAAREEHDAIATELVFATVLTLILSMASIYLLFLRIRAVPLLGLAIIVPVVITFGIAELAVDYLNTSTAFLGSIVIGNGINPGIVWLARYFEERRKGLDVYEALRATHAGTWAGTLSAALAAAVAYGSLVVADFRGFRDFGIIGFTGMVVCWFSMFLFLPALVVLSERVKKLHFSKKKIEGSIYGSLFLKPVLRAPYAIVTFFALVVIASIALAAAAVARDPLEYDFRKLRSERSTESKTTLLNRRIGQIVGTAATGNNIAVLTPSHEVSVQLRDRLVQMRDHENAAIGRIRMVDDLLPKEQETKIPIAREIRSLLLEAREFADDATKAEIDAHLPPETIGTVGIEDLPIEVARSFTERDGTRGRIIFVEAPQGRSTWDGRTLVDWAAELRKIKLPDGTRPPLAGRAPVFADMLEVILEDGPKAVMVSFLITALLVILALRKWIDRALTLGSLIVGVIWMTGVMSAFDMKLNFLNFVAFPVTFGNGVDYAINVMRRYVQEREVSGHSDNAIRAAISETGGAVVVCSLTTVFGYISLLTSANLALNSFGAAMSISELTCLTAAILLVPAILTILHRRRAAKDRRGKDESPDVDEEEASL